MDKKKPSEPKKKEIKIKKNPKEKALQNAPDEVIAKAIHDFLISSKKV